MTQNNLANIAAILSIIIWSVSGAVVVFLKTVPPVQLLAMYQFFGFGLYLIRWMRSGKVIEHFKFPLISYFLSLMGVCVVTVLYYLGLRTAPPVEVSLVNYLWPIFITIFSILIMHEKFKLRHFISILMAFIGVVILIVNPENIQHFDLKLGHVLAFSGAVIWGVYSVLARKHPVNQDNMGVIYGLSSLLLFCLSFLIEDMVLPTDFTQVGFIILLSSNVFAFSFWNYAMKLGDVKVIVIYSYFIPLLSMFWLIIFGLGVASGHIYIAATLIIGAAFVGNLDKIRIALSKVSKS